MAQGFATKILLFPPSRGIGPGMNHFPFDIVGFDLDGTLLDTHEDLAAAVNHALSLIGRSPVPASEVKKLVGGGAKLMLERALTITGGVPDDAFPRLHEELLRFYEDNIAIHTRLYPGGLAMLDRLAARGAKLAVVTNKLEGLSLRLFDELALRDRFFAIIGGDTLGIERRKPKPDMLEEMIRRGGGGRAAYVGDTTYDTRAAKAAGLPCVAVAFGFNDLPPDQLGADAVIDHFDELIPALAKL
jgi:phosphoglycolate phosphatase